MKPILSEKAVMLIETQNILVFEVEKQTTKTEIKKEFENLFKIKVESVNTLIRKNKKYAYIKLNSENPAIDIATKLGMI